MRARLAEPVAPRVDGVDARTRRLLRMLHFVLRSARNPWRDLQRALDDLWAQRAVCRELVELLALLDAGATTRTRTLAELGDVPVRLHARYDRAEVLTAFDRLAVENPFHHVAGVEHVPAHRADLLFVTLRKSDASFSPTTMYRD
jgi:hypothetical protein